MSIDLTQKISIRCLAGLLVLFLSFNLAAQQQASNSSQLAEFQAAWKSASSGDRSTFENIKNTLSGFVLYPYLQYEDYRFRRKSVAAEEMSAFLQAHRDWAFTAGLEKSWLRSLGQRKKWDALLLYATNEDDVEVKCYFVQAQIQRGIADKLEAQAQELWAVGQSQPKACDPVFHWLRKEGGITAELAWLRVSRAMTARNRGLAQYLSRFIPANDRVWVQRWQSQDKQSYRHLDQALKWQESEKTREITAYGLKRLARNDSDRAWKLFRRLDGKVLWAGEQRAGILKEIAMWSAVENAADTVVRLHAVPVEARDSLLLEWWARNGLANGNWAEVLLAISNMNDELKNSGRWRYWDARARLILGEPDYARGRMSELSSEANYYGFLAADYLDQPYSICPQEPSVDTSALNSFKDRPLARRIVALRDAGMKSWSMSEWSLAAKSMSKNELRFAAALAEEHGWPDLVILALASSGDRSWYEWRFPLAFTPLVEEQAGKRNLDTAWVMGLMRAESAMAEDAISSANARGLMQVLPSTAAQLARRNSLQYSGTQQLMQAEHNIIFGTTFLRELMDRFDQNPMLASGAYNAGPSAVGRWLEALPDQDPLIWVEILPYYETRDYIPRVLAFATIYNWLMQQPVQRITSRMPAIDSGNMGAGSGTTAVTQVACVDSATTELPGS
jgi:soluble lytic murein transglycosylase